MNVSVGGGGSRSWRAQCAIGAPASRRSAALAAAPTRLGGDEAQLRRDRCLVAAWGLEDSQASRSRRASARSTPTPCPRRRASRGNPPGTADRSRGLPTPRASSVRCDRSRRALFRIRRDGERLRRAKNMKTGRDSIPRPCSCRRAPDEARRAPPCEMTIVIGAVVVRDSRSAIRRQSQDSPADRRSKFRAALSLLQASSVASSVALRERRLHRASARAPSTSWKRLVSEAEGLSRGRARLRRRADARP